METPEDVQRQIELRYADSNRNLAAGLAGTNVAIMTFFLFFGFDLTTAAQVDPTLFQATLGLIILTLFLFLYAAMGYYVYTEALLKGHPGAVGYLRRADGFLFASLLAITLEPALIMFTAKLPFVGALALILWLVSLVMIYLDREHQGHTPRIAQPARVQS